VTSEALLVISRSAVQCYLRLVISRRWHGRYQGLLELELALSERSQTDKIISSELITVKDDCANGS